jgi:hypothetical protein
MALNILKLCVGVSQISELADWQDERLRRTRRIYHVTRMRPRRAAEIVGRGSIYWVIRGMIMVRQKIVAIEPFTDEDGIGRCKLVFDAELVVVRPTPRLPGLALSGRCRCPARSGAAGSRWRSRRQDGG